jgi:Uma2 family endonuclease
MSTIATSPLAIAPSEHLLSGLYRFTVRQYDQMVDDGTIAEDAQVELIEGLLVRKMGKKRPHVQAGKKGLQALLRLVPAGWHVAKEDPMVASDWSKPEPDLAVVQGEVEDYSDRDVTASDIALVVEISAATFTDDRTTMGRIYATGGIPLHWIINLIESQIEVYTDPDPVLGQYVSRTDYRRGQDLPVIIDGRQVGTIAVAELLP